jgi:hypothetical protein
MTGKMSDIGASLVCRMTNDAPLGWSRSPTLSLLAQVAYSGSYTRDAVKWSFMPGLVIQY